MRERLAAERESCAPRLVFTTHSIPTASAETSGPRAAGRTSPSTARSRPARRGRGGRAGRRSQEGWDLVYQSRSGAPQIPWLEPDISDHLAALKADGVPGVVIVPIGFVSDHMEVVWDLDTVALDDAKALGLPALRAATVGTDPRFVAMVRELVLERVGSAEPRALSPLGPMHDVCPGTCCPNPRGERPALCQA